MRAQAFIDNVFVLAYLDSVRRRVFIVHVAHFDSHLSFFSMLFSHMWYQMLLAVHVNRFHFVGLFSACFSANCVISDFFGRLVVDMQLSQLLGQLISVSVTDHLFAHEE